MSIPVEIVFAQRSAGAHPCLFPGRQDVPRVMAGENHLFLEVVLWTGHTGVPLPDRGTTWKLQLWEGDRG